MGMGYSFAWRCGLEPLSFIIAEAAATPDVVDLQSPCQSGHHSAVSACRLLPTR